MRSGKLRLAAWIVGILVLAAGIYIALDLPLKMHLYYGCLLCRAGMARDTLLFIPTSTRIDDNDLSRYYQRNVDSAHEHIWQGVGGMYRFRQHTIYADGATLAQRLHPRAWLAILRSLPNRTTRKAFCEQFCIPVSSQKALGRVALACLKLNEAYRENPSRTDWPRLLRRVDFYPKDRS